MGMRRQGHHRPAGALHLRGGTARAGSRDAALPVAGQPVPRVGPHGVSRVRGWAAPGMNRREFGFGAAGKLPGYGLLEHWGRDTRSVWTSGGGGSAGRALR